MLSPQRIDALLQSSQKQRRAEFVERFSELLSATVPPAAISIDGLWGTGKTSVMRRLQEQLRAQGYPVFWFNPWKFRPTRNVVLAFLHTLFLSAADSPCFRDMRAHGATILRLLTDAGLDAGLRAITGPDAAPQPGWTAFSSAASRGAVPFEDYLKAHRTIEQEFVEVLMLISRHYDGKPVMMFVDDLDRCIPGDILHFLQALKHVLLTHGSRAVCVCGIDTSVATQCLLKAYPHKGSVFADNLFRQVFPITLSMPYSAAMEDALAQYILSTYPAHLPVRQQADALATMIYTRGLQSDLTGARKFLNVAGNFRDFLCSLPQYRWQPDNDFILNLLVIQEAWPELYRQLLEESLTHELSMQQLIRHMAEQHRLHAPQEKFLSAYVGCQTAFACEYLAVWMTYHPMLNALAA